MKVHAVRLAVFAMVAVAYLGGGLNFLDNSLRDLSFRVTDRPASGNVVVVAIDSKSIAEVGVWPWSRRLHAELVSRLDAAGVSGLAFLIDFSSRSTNLDDRALAEAIAQSTSRVTLSEFRQPVVTEGNATSILETKPIPPLRAVAEIAHINLYPAPDGRIRHVEAVDTWGGQSLPRVAAKLAATNLNERAVPESFHLDFGIRPESIPVVSFVDVLNGRFAAAEMAGKDVLVGSTAVELGNHVPVPVGAFLPGVMIEALAYEAIIQDRTLQRLPLWIGLIGALLAVWVTAPLFVRWSWHDGLVALVIFSAVAVGLAHGLYAQEALLFDAAPLLAAALASYFISVFGQLNRLARDLYAQRLAVEYRRALTSAIVQHSFDGILTINLNGEIRNLNMAAEQIFSCRKEDLIGSDASVLFPFSDDDGYVGDVLGFLRGRAAHSGSEEPIETVGRRRGGQVFPMELSVVEPKLQPEKRGLRSEPERSGLLVCTVRDISRRKVAEDKVWQLNEELEQRVLDRTRQLEDAQQDLLEQERLATLGRLVATVSHELRNPLGTIRNSVRYIRMWDEASALGEVVERLERNVVRCDRIITELLDYSRDRPLVAEPLPIDSWLRNVIDEFSIPDDVALSWTPSADEPEVAIDATRLSLAITNILENACQAMEGMDRGDGPAEAKRLSVTRLSVEDRIVIRISDSGIGIAPTDLDRIFEPFFSTKGFGVGLGLPLASSVVKQHGGDIEVNSEMDKGTAVTIWLPIDRDSEENAA